MGRVKPSDLRTGRIFLETINTLFEIIRPNLDASTSIYAQEAIDLYDKVFRSLYEMESNFMPNKDDIKQSSTNYYEWEAHLAESYLRIKKPYNSLRYYLSRKCIKDYSRPGKYKETWSIEYINIDSYLASPKPWEYYHNIQRTHRYRLESDIVLPHPFTDSDFICISAGNLQLKIQITSDGYYAISLTKGEEFTNKDPWNERAPSWNIWLKDPSGEIHSGNMAYRYRIPRVSHSPIKIPTYPANSIHYEDGDIIGHMMAEICRTPYISPTNHTPQSTNSLTKWLREFKDKLINFFS